MTVRAAIPHRVKVAGRLTSVRLGSATAAGRQLPSFILVGAQRAGTTSLFRALMSHPLVSQRQLPQGRQLLRRELRPRLLVVPGPLPHRGVPALTEPWPTRATRSPSRPAATTCSTPAPPRGWRATCLTSAILAMLRDPVERAYSAYKHELARGFETESFETRARAGGRPARG